MKKKNIRANKKIVIKIVKNQCCNICYPSCRDK